MNLKVIPKELLEYLVEEFDNIEASKVFNDKEFKRYKVARLDFEKKFHSRKAVSLTVLEDYLEHLQIYVGTICGRLGDMLQNHLSLKYINTIKLRMLDLQEMGMKLYGKNKLNFLPKYIKFCMDNEFIYRAKSFLTEHYGNDVDMWIASVDLMTEEYNDNNVALDFLDTAIKSNRGNEALYKYIFNVELEIAKSKGNAYKISCNSRLNGLVQKLLIELHTLEYYQEILNILLQQPFTSSVIRNFSRQLLMMNPDCPELWHRIAQDELLDKDIRFVCKAFIVEPDTRFAACMDRYRDGLLNISDANKPRLCKLYLEFVIKTRTDNSNQYNEELINKSLAQAVNDVGCLIDDEQYISWIESHQVKKDILLLLPMALRVHSQSTKLWRLRLHYATIYESKNKRMKVFLWGFAALKEQAYILWEYFLSYQILNIKANLKNLEKAKFAIKALFENGVKTHPNISNEIKAQYVQWLALAEGVESARCVYLRIANVPPYCKQLHNAMLYVEDQQAKDNFDAVETVHKLAKQQFKDDFQVWSKYIEFKVKYFYVCNDSAWIKERPLDLNIYLMPFYEQAKLALSEEEYNKMISNCMHLIHH